LTFEGFRKACHKTPYLRHWIIRSFSIRYNHWCLRCRIRKKYTTLMYGVGPKVRVVLRINVITSDGDKHFESGWQETEVPLYNTNALYRYVKYYTYTANIRNLWTTETLFCFYPKTSTTRLCWPLLTEDEGMFLVIELEKNNGRTHTKSEMTYLKRNRNFYITSLYSINYFFFIYIFYLCYIYF